MLRPWVICVLAMCFTGCASVQPPARPPMASASSKWCVEVTHLGAEGWDCVTEVDAKTQRRRSRTVRVTVDEQNHIVREELRNGRGSPVDEDVTDFEYRYEHGALAWEIGSDSHGVVRYKLHFSPDRRTVVRMDPWDRPHGHTRNPSNDFTVAKHDYDAQGLRLRTRYTDAEGRPRRLDSGASEVRLSYVGHELREMASFDAAGKPIEDADGVHRSTYERGPWGLTAVRNFRQDGRPTTGAASPIVRYTYDEVGNQRSVEFRDESDRLRDLPAAAARHTYRYDAAGSRIETQYERADGALARDLSFAIQTFQVDELGREVERVTLDADRKPAGARYSRTVKTWDARGDEVETRYFRPDGSAARLGKGFSAIRTHYNDRHDPIALFFVDESGRPARDADGVSSRAFAYDRWGQRTNERRLDERGALADAKGVARRELVYGDTGSIVERRYYDRADKRVDVVDLQFLLVQYKDAKKGEASKRTREEAESRAKDAAVRLRAGARFEDVARELGDQAELVPIREVGPGWLVPEVDSAVRAQPVGACTDVLDTALGFVVARHAEPE